MAEVWDSVIRNWRNARVRLSDRFRKASLSDRARRFKSFFLRRFILMGDIVKVRWRTCNGCWLYASFAEPRRYPLSIHACTGGNERSDKTRYEILYEILIID